MLRYIIGWSMTMSFILAIVISSPIYAATTSMTVSPTAISFLDSQAIGTSSIPQIITLTNVGSAVLKITSVSVGGLNAAAFYETTTCEGASLPPTAACTVSVVFRPTVTASGIKSGSIKIVSNAVVSPATVTISGISTKSFSACSTTSLAESGAYSIVENEAGNPSVVESAVYTGYKLGSRSYVFATEDSRQAFPAPVVTTYPASLGFVKLSASNHHVTLASTDSLYNLYVTSSLSFGVPGSWTAPMLLGSSTVHAPALASIGDHVYIVWTTLAGSVMFSRSMDAGQTFSVPVALGAGTQEVMVSGHGNDVYVFWELGVESAGSVSVILAVSHDGGATFSVRNISESTGTMVALEPQISVDPASGRVSLVWRTANPQAGVYLKSTDSGTTWSAPMTLASPARQFMVADDGAYIYVSYLGRHTTTIAGVVDWETSVAVSADGGSNFSKRNLSGFSNISVLSYDNQRPNLFASGGLIRLVGYNSSGLALWSGTNGVLGGPYQLGTGTMAGVSQSSVTWQGPSSVKYAICH